MQWKYGISQEEYKALLRKQDGKCAVCRVSAKEALRPGRSKMKRGATHGLVVDHDHETGDVRGLLCNRCNRGIGMFEDDSKLLDAALRYLVNLG